MSYRYLLSATITATLPYISYLYIIELNSKQIRNLHELDKQPTPLFKAPGREKGPFFPTQRCPRPLFYDP